MTLLTRAVKFPVGFIVNAASRNVEGHRVTYVYIWPSSKALVYKHVRWIPWYYPGFSSCDWHHCSGDSQPRTQAVHERPGYETRWQQAKEKLPWRFIIYIKHIHQRYRHFGQQVCYLNTQLYFMHTLLHETDALHWLCTSWAWSLTASAPHHSTP